MTGTPTISADFAAEIAKQVVTVSSAIVGLTVTFAEKLDPDSAPPVIIPSAMIVAWFCFILAVVFAFWTLMALAGSANQVALGKAKSIDIMRSNIRIPSFLMVVVFVIALTSTVLAVANLV